MDYLLLLLPHIVTNGIILGATYGVLALGWGVIFQATRLLNFGLGEYVMVAGMLYVSLIPVAGVALAITAGIAAAIAASLITYKIVYLLPGKADFRGPSPAMAIPVTLGIAIVLREGARAIWGPDGLPLQALVDGRVQIVAGVQISLQAAILICATVLAYIGLWIWRERTENGQALHAVSQSPRGAAICGIDSQKASALAFGLSGACAGVLGVLLAGYIPMSWSSGTMLGLKGLVAAILGGMTSPIGGLLGGLALGLVESLIAGFVSSALKDAISMVLLIAIVLWRYSPRRRNRRN